MPPVSVHVPGFQVAGLTVRTRNRDEMNPTTARIGGLWDRFFSESWEHKLPAAAQDGRIFGVYSAYESNEHGAYDVTAGVAANPSEAQGEDAAVRVVPVEAGDYLVFSGQGAMPQMVIDTWGQIWHYFAHNPRVRRRFGTDFEAYRGPDEVAIHIGIVRA